MRPRTLATLAAALAVWASSARAEDSPNFRFSGFGTLGAVHSSEKNADFTAQGTQANGAGHSRNPAFSPDSKLAGQVDGKFSPEFSATAQVVAQHQVDNSYDPEFMLAFGKWQATPTLAIRAGRLAMPWYLISDYRLVGYSLPWVRPPMEMYESAIFYHYDGADATWSTLAGDVALKSQVYVGKSKTAVPDTSVDAPRILGVNLTAESGVSTYRLSYMKIVGLTVSSPALDNVFQIVRSGLPAGALGPGSPALPASPQLADQYELRNKTAKYYSAGFNHDPGDWFVMAEVGMSPAVGVSAELTSGYIAAGVRQGSLTPYATLSTTRNQAADLSGHPILDRVIQGSANAGRKSTGLGLRWDARKNLALKTQLDHTNLDEGSAGSMRNVQPEFQPGSSFNVFSVSLDFVF